MSSVDHAAVRAAAHARGFELLPWYQNGSLAGQEQAELRAHLGECLVCRRELQRLEVLAQALQVPASEQAGALAYQRLALRLREADGRRRWWRPGAWVAALKRLGTPVPLGAGAAAGALVALLLVLGGEDRGVAPRAPDQRFQTLGAQPASGTQLAHPLIRIVLDETLDTAARSAWLARHEAELVDGPSNIGVLTVRVALGSRNMSRVLDELRSDPATLFVEAIDVVGTRPDRRR
jgi:hypothetical protein